MARPGARAGARIGRWMGAIVVEAGGEQRLVGNPKEPCTFTPPVPLSSPLEVDADDAGALAARMTERLVIARNGSVSERLWRLVTHDGATGAQWLVDMPAHVWDIVRDSVLRCS
jgi:hypothetical protein